MARRTVIAAAGGALLLAVGAAWWLMRPAGPESGPREAPVVSLPGRAAVAPPVELPAPVAGVTSAALAAVEEAPARAEGPAPIPESYRRALGGITGRVVEEDGRPVANIKVELGGARKSLVMRANDAFLQPEGLELPVIVGAATTGADGRFEMAAIDPRTYGVVLVDPGGPRALLHPLYVTPDTGVTRDVGDIVMPGCVTLTGRVIDEREKPVAGARVRAAEVPIASMPGADPIIESLADYRTGGGVLVTKGAGVARRDFVYVPPAPLARLETHLPLPTTQSGPDGRFELSGVPSGIVLLVIDDGRHRPRVQTGLATGAVGSTRDLGDLAMADGLTLHGRVLDGHGKPVAGAEVLAGSTLMVAEAAVLKGPVVTGADGAFEFTGLREGDVYAAARPDARHEYSIGQLPSPSSGTLDITLATPRRLTVDVLDELGRPVSGAQFWGCSTKEQDAPDLFMPPHSLADRVHPGEHGGYVIEDLHPASWQIVIKAEGYHQERCEADLTAGDGLQEVRLEKGTGLTVHVVRESDKSAVEYACVEVFRGGKEEFGQLLTAARTDAAGRAQLRDLPPGDIMVNVTHPALAVTGVPATLPRDEELLVPLTGGATVVGSVVDNGMPPGEPLMVMLMPESAPGDAELPRSTVTDSNGAFRFERVEPCQAHIEARSRHELQSGFSFIEAFINSPLAQADIDVPASGELPVVLAVGVGGDVETGQISGHVTVNGRPGDGWQVRTWGQIRRSVTANERGDFDLGRIESGTANLMISAPGMSVMQGYTKTEVVQLASGEQKWVDIDFSTGVITGRLRSAGNGEPVRGATVHAVETESDSSGWGRPSGLTGAGGEFRIEPVVAGKYQLTVRADGYANLISEELEVQPQQTLSGVELRLTPALVAKGRIEVKGSDEAPRWLWLVANRGEETDKAENTARDTARVDSDTRTFSFDGLSPGEWTFTLATDLDTEFETVKQTLTHDVDNLVLTFTAKPPEVTAEVKDEAETDK